MISNQHKSRWTALLSLLGLVLLAGPSGAQNADDRDLAFWSKSTVAKAAAAAELVLARHPLTVVILRDHGQRYSVWGHELAFAGTEAPPLTGPGLQTVRDGL